MTHTCESSSKLADAGGFQSFIVRACLVFWKKKECEDSNMLLRLPGNWFCLLSSDCFKNHQSFKYFQCTKICGFHHIFTGVSLYIYICLALNLVGFVHHFRCSEPWGIIQIRKWCHIPSNCSYRQAIVSHQCEWWELNSGLLQEHYGLYGLTCEAISPGPFPLFFWHRVSHCT